MKALRHAKIKELIEKQIVETQEDLAELLRNEGIDVTQATVSRDIKEMLLFKVPSGDGRYRYAVPQDPGLIFSQNRMARVFKDAILDINHSQNLCVVRTLPGSAQAVALALDNVKWPEIIGTIAGDDTVLLVIKDEEKISGVIERISKLIVV